MSRQSLRDKLIERAKYGEITGEEADAEAIRLGLGSLSRRPSPDEFRPESMAHWTLPMVLAWIAYLDLNEVREWSAPYLERCWYWVPCRWQDKVRGPIYNGWMLEQHAKPTVALLRYSASANQADKTKRMSATIGEAQESLWMMLREGFLKATGIETAAKGHRVEIPALDWYQLVPVQGLGEKAEVRRRPFGDGYKEVLIPSAVVQRYWRHREVPVYTLPALMPPDGHGYMPLFCAAQWIATEGGKRNFDPSDVEAWRPAFRDLLAAIASEAVRVLGVSHNQTQPVPAYLFAGIRIDYPYADTSLDLILTDELVLRSYAYVDEEHWFKGFDDALVDRRGDHWSRLMVEKGDVRARWPFGPAPQARTGLPGRPPLSKHLIEDELRRRASAGLNAETLAEEAEALLGWLREAHPDHAPPTVRTIENNIRDEYRRLRPTK